MLEAGGSNDFEGTFLADLSSLLTTITEGQDPFLFRFGENWFPSPPVPSICRTELVSETSRCLHRFVDNLAYCSSSLCFLWRSLPLLLLFLPSVLREVFYCFFIPLQRPSRMTISSTVSSWIFSPTISASTTKTARILVILALSCTLCSTCA